MRTNDPQDCECFATALIKCVGEEGLGQEEKGTGGDWGKGGGLARRGEEEEEEEARQEKNSAYGKQTFPMPKTHSLTHYSVCGSAVQCAAPLCIFSLRFVFAQRGDPSP